MKKHYAWLLYTVVFLSVIGQAQAQDILNPLAANKNSKLQLGLAEVVSVKQNNINAILNESNVPLFSLQNFKENNSKIRVDIISKGNGDVLFAELVNLDIEIVARQQNYFTCWAEISQIDNYLKKAPSISFMRSSLKPVNNAVPVHSQGDSAQRSDLARALGVNGAGVKVGVLSDSYNHKGGAATGVTNGELPGGGNPSGFTTPITVLAEMIGNSGSDEGRAMLEIIHDVAPGAELYFYTAFNGEADFAAGIRALADSGCNVIVDDVSYLSEPMFQDGVIAQAVDYAVNVKGASYFSSAGNLSNQSYANQYLASTFTPMGESAGTAHNFGTVAHPIYYLPIAKTNSNGVRTAFQWDEPSLSAGNGSPGSNSDLDIYLFKYNGTSYTVVAKGIADNLGGDPTEIAQIFGTETFYVAILKYAGPDPTNLKINFYGGINWNTSTPDSIVGIKAGTTAGHANAIGAITTGAAHYAKTPAFGIDPPEVETFSSKGGAEILFTKAGVRLATPEDRLKPEITAPDGANNSFFGNDSDSDGSPNFFGTSAAAPHAAAVAALMLEAEPSFTPANILAELVNSSTDMDDPTTAGFDVGFDYTTGAGLIKADVAVQAAINSFCKVPPTNVSVNLKSICSGSSVVLKATCASGVISWYDSENGGASLGTGNSFIQYPVGNTTYYAACNNVTCETSRVATVLVSVTPVSVSVVSALSSDTTTFNAIETITAANKIISPASAIYTAGNNILLNQGFEAENGSTFLAQIAGCQNIAIPGLIAYYPFNGNANDETGNGYNGVINGATLTADKFGAAQKALNFAGNASVRIPNLYNASTQPMNDVTYSLWFKPNQNYGAADFYSLIIRTTDGGFTDMIGKPDLSSVENNKFQFYMFDNVVNVGRLTKATAVNFTANQWVHVVVTRANGTMKIYVNAAKEGETVYTNALYFYPDLYLGGHATLNRWYFNGAMDDVRVYNRALTDAEIQAIYNAEKS